MSKKILVIDDDKVTLSIIRDLLEEGGYDVCTATSSLESNKFIYDDPPPDLILLDVVMPFLDGTKKTGFIKEREASRDIPVILISSKSRHELQELARTSGADGFLTKPVTKASLLGKISRYL